VDHTLIFRLAQRRASTEREQPGRPADHTLIIELDLRVCVTGAALDRRVGDADGRDAPCAPIGSRLVGASDGPIFEHRPTTPRWTHIALRVADIDASIAWYETFTPLRLLDRRQDELGYGAWLGQPDMAEHPFILVLAQFFEATDPFKASPREVLAPFAHLGIELPERADIEAIAARAEPAGCLAMPPTEMPPPIGYICMLRDPDGNMVEFSYDQGVYAKAREVWGS
jgi:catechol 2,3-dioxygenase-like lactoylglutathione lyase family enzyme